MFLVGGNPVMARLVGIHVDRVVIACYMLSGLLAATAGLVLSGFVGLVDNCVGRGFELDSIVAAVLGGVALSGGRGTILGALGWSGDPQSLSRTQFSFSGFQYSFN